MSESNQSQYRATIDSELHTFLIHLNGLHETLPLVMHSIITATKEAVNKFEYFQEQQIIRDSPDGSSGLLINLKHFREFEIWDKSIKGLGIAHKIIPRSFLVSIISQYDAFLGGIIRAMYYIKPELLNSSERNLSFSQLVRFNSIEEAREHIIEKEVETVLRKSHAEQFAWMETKYDISLRKGLDIWPDFIEITERRNLFVHTNGLISSQYLNVCSDHGVELERDAKVGTELDLPPAYLRHAFNVLFEISVKLAHVLWRKFQPNDREKADVSLNNTKSS